MLVARAADLSPVVSRALMLASLGASAIVLLSFGLFARDQLSGASKHQQIEISQGYPTTPGEIPQPSHHGQPRRFIDGAAHDLMSPFDAVVSTTSAWMRRGSATLFAL